VTSTLAIADIFKCNDIILVQEHWLFQSQTDLLSEVHENINSVGKGTDYNDPLLPTQLPRGFGGVGVLWKKELDPKVTVLDDGGNRIQCLQLSNFKDNKGLVIVSVYMPCRGLSGNVTEFCDCVDQLREIILKYNTDNFILVGCDFNENLGGAHGSRRLNYLKELVNDFDLKFENSGETYLDPRGNECTEIDFYLYNVPSVLITSRKVVLNDLRTNTSDHYPITVELLCNFTLNIKPEESVISTRVNWRTIDKHVYSIRVKDGLATLETEIDDDNVDEVVKDFCELMSESASNLASRRKPFNSKPKLKVWNPEIRDNVMNMKSAYKAWKRAGRPRGESSLLTEKNLAKRALRSSVRQAIAKKDYELKQKIIESRKYDSRTFHKLVNSQRNKQGRFITDLYVGNQRYQEDKILCGFHDHFEALGQQAANELFDNVYDEIVNIEYELTVNMNRNQYVQPVTKIELEKAVKSLNTGKAPDVYNMSVEHILNCEDSTFEYLLKVVSHVFASGLFPAALKRGVVTPIFKNKGEPNVSGNYRGITILPVIGKVIEAILRDRIAPNIKSSQNIFQRGFTKNSSPLNSAFIVEELYRECHDNRSEMHLIFLDARSAFDVVDHKHLMRRLGHIGVSDKHWSLIDSFHRDSTSAVKWKGRVSAEFSVQQGVRQG